MRIIYLDLNHPDFFEDYSVNSKRYGGGKIFAAEALQRWDNLHLFADQNCFDNITEQRILDKCFHLPWESRKALREGAPVKDFISNAQYYDLFVHHHSNINLNLNGLNAKSCAWAVGVGEHIHQSNILLYSREFQRPQFFECEKIYDIVIGKPINPFQQRTKEPFLFQCSRHNPEFGTAVVAQLAHKYQFNFKFAGPIQNGYDIPIGNTVEYLGILNEETKMDFTSRAAGYVLLHGWAAPFSLSAIEALSVNTPIITTNVGFWPSLIQNGINGFLVKDEQGFVNAAEQLKTLNQLDIYNTSLPYSTEKMLESFQKAFEEILK